MGANVEWHNFSLSVSFSGIIFIIEYTDNNNASPLLIGILWKHFL